jgi:hypothetical protein
MDVDDILALMEIEGLLLDRYCFLDRKTVFCMYRDFEESAKIVADPKSRKHFLQLELLNLKSELSQSGKAIAFVFSQQQNMSIKFDVTVIRSFVIAIGQYPGSTCHEPRRIHTTLTTASKSFAQSVSKDLENHDHCTECHQQVPKESTENAANRNPTRNIRKRGAQNISSSIVSKISRRNKQKQPPNSGNLPADPPFIAVSQPRRMLPGGSVQQRRQLAMRLWWQLEAVKASLQGGTSLAHVNLTIHAPVIVRDLAAVRSFKISLL